MPTTLELVKDDNEFLAVLIKLAENKIKVVEASTHGIVVDTPCGTCGISWARCSCHGGRMWLNHNPMCINIELSSEEYDEDLGITDADTELAYYIDNNMIPTILGFDKYVYSVIEKGKYGCSDSNYCHYFKSCEEASKYVFGDNKHHLDAETGTVTRTFPNKRIKEEIEYVEDTRDGIHFVSTHYEKNEVKYKVDIYFKVFRKKKA